MHQGHPVKLVVMDDLRRNRWRVFFTIVLAILHFVWLFLWSVLMVVVVIANWVVAMVTGRPASGLHRLSCSYIRYATHVNAYVDLVANPYPGFSGEAGAYPIDVQLPEPAPQSRWKTFFRLFLPVPAARSPSRARSSAGSHRSRKAGCRRGSATHRRTAWATPRRLSRICCSSRIDIPTQTPRRCSRASDGHRSTPFASSVTPTTCASHG